MSTLSEIVIDIVKKYHNAFVQKRILKTAEEVSACTNNKNIPSATVVGELINKLTQVRTYVGSDGKLHFVDSEGADSVLNFNGNFTIITSGKSATSESDLDSSFKITKAGLLIVATYNLLYPSTAVIKNGTALNALQTVNNSVCLKIFASKVKAGDTIRVYSLYNSVPGNFRGAGFIAGLV